MIEMENTSPITDISCNVKLRITVEKGSDHNVNQDETREHGYMWMEFGTEKVRELAEAKRARMEALEWVKKVIDVTGQDPIGLVSKVYNMLEVPEYVEAFKVEIIFRGEHENKDRQNIKLDVFKQLGVTEIYKG